MRLLNPPLIHATRTPFAYIIHMCLFLALICSLRSAPPRPVIITYYKRVHSKFNGSLFLWCEQRLRRADDIRFIWQNRIQIRNENVCGKRGLNLRNFILFLPIAFRVLILFFFLFFFFTIII